jgi:hypothetical protein
LPIVFGENRAAYEMRAPADSFIHVDDFSSIKELAAYLNYLDKNDTAYKERFKWKSSYYLADTMFYCRLCKLLQSSSNSSYEDIEKWWHKTKICYHV